MKAEERKHLKDNAFQDWLGRAWRSITSGSTANTIVWSAILIGLLGLIGWRYYSDASRVNQSALWYELDSASTVDALNAIIQGNKGTAAARIARFHLARSQAQDAMLRLAGPSATDRAAAADELQSARDDYRGLIQENRSEPILAQEAMINVAKAEETLASVPKSGSETEMRGSLDHAIVLYQDLAKRFPKSFLGEAASKRAQEIFDHRSQFEAFNIAMAKVQGVPTTPELPPLPTPPTPGTSIPGLPKPAEAPDAKTPEKPAEKPEDKPK
jgi:hypothetical protein